MEDNKQYCTIYIVRHGETEYNVKDIVQSQVDSPLTEQGKRQAKDRAETLKHVHFDAIFSSHLGRAVKTAEILKLQRQLAVNTTKLLREKEFGVYDGMGMAEFRKLINEQMKLREIMTEQERLKHKYHPSWENEEEAADRIITILREIAIGYIGKTVLAVSHGSIMRSLLMRLGFGSYYEFPPGSIDNTAYIKLESDGVDFFIKETKGINKKKLEN